MPELEDVPNPCLAKVDVRPSLWKLNVAKRVTVVGNQPSKIAIMVDNFSRSGRLGDSKDWFSNYRCRKSVVNTRQEIVSRHMAMPLNQLLANKN